MIEFNKERTSNKWYRKYPRTRIKNRGGDREAHKEAGWFKYNLANISVRREFKNLGRFLKANVGRPVNKVYSEFLKRCGKSVQSNDLKQAFYGSFRAKEDIGCEGGLYITNGILNYKKRTRCNNRKSHFSIEDRVTYNITSAPKNVKCICDIADFTMDKVVLGKFYIDYNSDLRTVYLIRTEVFEDKTRSLNTFYKRCEIVGVGSRVTKYSWTKQNRAFDKTECSIETMWHCPIKPEYIFITKA